METLVRVFFAVVLTASIAYIGARALTAMAKTSNQFHEQLRDHRW